MFSKKKQLFCTLVKSSLIVNIDSYINRCIFINENDEHVKIKSFSFTMKNFYRK